MSKQVSHFVSIILLSMLTHINTFGQAEGRVETEMNKGWTLIESQAKILSDIGQNTKTETIDIPHDWGFEEAPKGNRKYYRGVKWYKKELAIIPKEGKRYFIKFGAVGTVADVYLIHQLLGQY